VNVGDSDYMNLQLPQQKNMKSQRDDTLKIVPKGMD